MLERHCCGLPRVGYYAHPSGDLCYFIKCGDHKTLRKLTQIVAHTEIQHVPNKDKAIKEALVKQWHEHVSRLDIDIRLNLVHKNWKEKPRCAALNIS